MEESPGWGGRRRGGPIMEGHVGYLFRANLQSLSTLPALFHVQCDGHPSHRCSPPVAPFFSSLPSQIITVVIWFSSLAVSILHPTSLVAIPLFPLSEPIALITSSPEKRLSESEEMQTSPVRQVGLGGTPPPLVWNMSRQINSPPFLTHLKITPTTPSSRH